MSIDHVRDLRHHRNTTATDHRLYYGCDPGKDANLSSRLNRMKALNLMQPLLQLLHLKIFHGAEMLVLLLFFFYWYFIPLVLHSQGQ